MPHDPKDPRREEDRPDEPDTRRDAERGPMWEAAWEHRGGSPDLRDELLRAGVDEGEGTPLVASRDEIQTGDIMTTDHTREMRPHFAVAVAMLAVMVLVTWLSLILLANLAGRGLTTGLIPGFWSWAPIAVVIGAATGALAGWRIWPKHQNATLPARMIAALVTGVFATSVVLFVVAVVGQVWRGLVLG